MTVGKLVKELEEFLIYNVMINRIRSVSCSDKKPFILIDIDVNTKEVGVPYIILELLKYDKELNVKLCDTHPHPDVDGSKRMELLYIDVRKDSKLIELISDKNLNF